MNEAPTPKPVAPMAPPPAPLPPRNPARDGAPPPPKPLAPVVAPPVPAPKVQPAPAVPQVVPAKPEVDEPEVDEPEVDEPEIGDTGIALSVLPPTSTAATSPMGGVGADDNRTPLPEETVLGEYTITRKLGQGGFGITYLARHTEKGTVVVIKEHMPSGLAVREPDSTYVTSASPEAEENFHHTMVEFMEEMTVLQGLEHPGIVPILSSFEANGTAYYVMPYVEGKSLEISVKPTLDQESRQRQARTIRQQLSSLLDTLEYMEQHQVIHRDIKPENIVITTDGRLILLDFGSARQLRPGKVFTNIFTPDFCAPEQALASDDITMSARLGPWTDIYSLGATFHYLITRMLPPRADMRGHAELDPYKPLATRQELCRLYGAVFLQAIDRAMEINPRNRWQTAAEWRQSTLTGLMPSSPRAMQRAKIIMAASAVVVGILGGVSFWAIRERNQAVQMYNLSLQFSEGILYDFNEELSDVPEATKLQAQLVTQLKNYLDGVDKLSLASDEKLQRALSSAWRNLGYIYLEQGDLEAATEALLRATGLQEELVERYPENQSYRYNLARIWLYRAEVARRRNLTPTATRFVGQAMESLTALCEQTPGNPDYKIALGKAMEVTASLARTGGDRELYKKSTCEHLALYQSLSGTYPRNTAVQTGLGYAWLYSGQLSMDEGNYKEAMESLEKGKKIFAQLSESNPYRLSFKKGLASVYLAMGVLRSRMGEQENSRRNSFDNDALSDYEHQLDLARELADLDPDNAEYTYMQCRTMSLMVDILLRTKRSKQAEAYSNTILQKVEVLLATAPDNADYAVIKAGALRGLAMAHGKEDYKEGQATEEMEESRDIMEHLISQAPGNLAMWYLYIDVLSESAKLAAARGDVQNARSWLESAIRSAEKFSDGGTQPDLIEARLNELRKLLSEIKKKKGNGSGK